MNITISTAGTAIGFGQMQIQGSPTKAAPIGPRRKEIIENEAWQRALAAKTTSFSFFKFGTWWEVWLEFPPESE